jgi:hypothetical protein
MGYSLSKLVLRTLFFGCCIGGLTCFIQPASADEHGTLFKWTYGDGGEGGPDLNEPIVTDRPDFTEASSTVGAGVVQLEMGYTFFKNNDDGADQKTHSFPETLLRVGMFADWFEFRADWNYAVEKTEIGGISNRVDGA